MQSLLWLLLAILVDQSSISWVTPYPLAISVISQIISVTCVVEGDQKDKGEGG